MEFLVQNVTTELYISSLTDNVGFTLSVTVTKIRLLDMQFIIEINCW